jgi:head-tail adaptor
MGIGDFRHVGMIQTVETVPDGDGGMVEVWTDAPPAWPIDIRPATVRDLERQTAGTIVATATHVIHGRDRADVTVTCRLVFDGRVFQISGLARPRERPIDLYLFAKEVI